AAVGVQLPHHLGLGIADAYQQGAPSRAGTGWWGLTRQAGASRALRTVPLTTKSLRRLWQAQSSRHSARAASLPRSSRYRAPWRIIICPNTGSTIALAYAVNYEWRQRFAAIPCHASVPPAEGARVRTGWVRLHLGRAPGLLPRVRPNSRPLVAGELDRCGWSGSIPGPGGRAVPFPP